MRIAHLVAHVSPDGRYGGPLRVAADIARVQRELGHEVRIFATYEGYETAPADYLGVPLTAFRARRLARHGYASLVSLGLMSAVARASRTADVVHVHLARDLLTSPTTLLLAILRRRYVLQTHGMVEPKRSRGARLFDALVLRPIARRAQSVLTLTPSETRHFKSIGVPEANIREQRNGVALNPLPERRRHQVLFLARLHPRKGAAAFAAAAVAVAPAFNEVHFTIAGPDEGDLTAVQRILEHNGSPPNVKVIGPVRPELVSEEMAKSLLYVLPADREPFGLTIIEALAQGTPVLVNTSAALAALIEEAGAGVSCSGDIASLEMSMKRLLTKRQDLELLARGARTLSTSFDIRVIATDLTNQYRKNEDER